MTVALGPIAWASLTQGGGGQPALFDPSQISTRGWYDGSDSSKMAATGVAVDSLMDLSGNARHLNGSGSQRPTWDSVGKKIEFDGITNLLSHSSPYLWNLSEKCVYLVANVVQASNVCILGETASTASSSRYMPLATGNGATLNDDLCPRIVSQANSSIIINKDLDAPFTGSKAIIRLHEKKGMITAWINGKVGFRTRNYKRNSGDLIVVRQCLGAILANTANSFAAMDFFEMVVCDNDNFGEQIEGYLAHKHSMTAMLPAGHRYKSSPPRQGQSTDYSIKPNSGPIQAVIFGDSLTAQNTGVVSGIQSFEPVGNFVWYNQLARGRIILQLQPTSFNKGVSGNTLSQMIARMRTDLDPLTFDACFFMGGTNNLLSDSETDMRDKIDTILSYLTLERGVTCVIRTITPKDDADGSLRPIIARTNEYILQRHGSCLGRVIAVDVNTIMNDGNGLPVANSLADQVHYSQYGGYLVGKAMDAALAPIFGRGALPDFGGAENILTNGNLTGSGGMSPSGQVANGWTLTDAIPGDPTASKNVNGEQIIGVNFSSTGAATNTWKFAQSVASGFGNGDTIYAAALVEVHGAANVAGLQLDLTLTPSSAQTNYKATGNLPRNGLLPQVYDDSIQEFLIFTPTIPIGVPGFTSAEVALVFSNRDSGVTTTAQVTIKKIGLFKR